jgi:hypothetical protein
MPARQTAVITDKQKALDMETDVEDYQARDNP